jgi:hypothetical protein
LDVASHDTRRRVELTAKVIEVHRLAVKPGVKGVEQFMRREDFSGTLIQADQTISQSTFSSAATETRRMAKYLWMIVANVAGDK